MQKVVVEKETPKNDPVATAIDTPDDKLCQFTIIPTGGVNAFAVSKTVQQFGKEGAFVVNGVQMTPMEYYMQTIFKYNRSRGGSMLAGVMKLAMAKIETAADQEAERQKYIT